LSTAGEYDLRLLDLTLSPGEEAFRDELRAWLEANHPGPEPGGDEASFEFRREWQRKLDEGGWAGVSWPKEYGGRGATLVEQAIFNEETVRARTPQVANVLGLAMGGPTVIAHGSEEQRRRYLPPILSADEIWCQGFSEPDSGSDLASLKTRAVRDGDEWVVTGQKVWTTFAHHAKWCMLVARTDQGAPKHKGLTYFLMDMQQDAVQVRPLVQITGEAEFNELFIEEARIPDGNIIGGEGNGWAVAITTLMHERATLAFGLQVAVQIAIGELIERAQDSRAQNGHMASDDPLTRQRLAQLLIESEVLRLNAYRGLSAIMREGVPGPEGSLGKWHWSEVNQSLTELAMDIAGPRAMTTEDHWTYRFLRARANSIEGGTTEILKNIVAERVLGLPRMR
jgi:alkylation response protein AidB-like acyl-CoA dehydrogenase